MVSWRIFDLVTLSLIVGKPCQSLGQTPTSADAHRRVTELLARRKSIQAAFDAGAKPKFFAETQHVGSSGLIVVGRGGIFIWKKGGRSLFGHDMLKACHPIKDHVGNLTRK